MNAKPGRDRGRTRQLAAQITSLIIAQQNADASILPNIDATAIDQLYQDHLEFDKNGPLGKRILKIFDLLLQLLQDGKRPRLSNHDTIHAALIVDLLLDDFTHSWRDEFAPALDKFLGNVTEGKKDRMDESSPNYQFWSRYGALTQGNTADGGKIFERHTFYVEQMLKNMPSTSLKDSKRTFSAAERVLTYFRQRKACAVCGKEVIWRDVNIHHVKEHQCGGKTELKNAALVHESCHPRTAEAVAAFANRWAN